MQTPYCYYGCSIPPFFLSFFLSHFPIKICTHFFSMKTSIVDLKLWYNVQNGLDFNIQHFLEIYPYIKKVNSSSKLQPDAPHGRDIEQPSCKCWDDKSIQRDRGNINTLQHGRQLHCGHHAATCHVTTPYRQTRVTLTHCSMAGSCSVAIVQPHAVLQVHTDRQG